MIFGIFSRRESPTQTSADALEQVRTGEIWGSVGRHNLAPCVRAYAFPLADGDRGIDFTTTTAPHNASMPFEVRWYYPLTPGVMLRTRDGIDYAAIDAIVTNKQP
jgi:hypothetical protein